VKLGRSQVVPMRFTTRKFQGAFCEFGAVFSEPLGCGKDLHLRPSGYKPEGRSLRSTLRAIVLRVQPNFLNQINVMLAVQSRLKKYISSSQTQITATTLAIPSR
jgi:hypothetical protein